MCLETRVLVLPTKTVFLGRGFFSRLGAATFRRHLGCSHLRDLSWDFVFVPLSSLLWRAGGESDWGSETSPCVPQDWLTPTHRAASQHSAAYLAYAHKACHISSLLISNRQPTTRYYHKLPQRSDPYSRGRIWPCSVCPHASRRQTNRQNLIDTPYPIYQLCPHHPHYSIVPRAGTMRVL